MVQNFNSDHFEYMVATQQQFKETLVKKPGQNPKTGTIWRIGRQRKQIKQGNAHVQSQHVIHRFTRNFLYFQELQ